jgi:membrane dipeptidase
MNNELIKSKAKELHKDNIVIDSHLDLGGIVYNRRKKGKRKILDTLFLEDFRRGGFNFIVGAIFIENEHLPDLALRIALKQIQNLKNDIDECSDDFMLVKSKEDMDAALESNKIGIILSLEGAEPIYDDLELLETFYELGVRGLGITWSRRNLAADGCTKDNVSEGIQGGFTPFGIDLVKRCEELGIYLDISHLNDAGFKDMERYAQKPFIASHSNARSITDIKRNLTDEQIRFMGEKACIIGINAYSKIVSLEEDRMNIDGYCDQLEYIFGITGENGVGLGFDLCSLYYEDGTILDVLNNHGESLLITETLLKRGFSDDSIKKIIGGNFYDFIRKNI